MNFQIWNCYSHVSFDVQSGFIGKITVERDNNIILPDTLLSDSEIPGSELILHVYSYNNLKSPLFSFTLSYTSVSHTYSKNNLQHDRKIT